jgi:cytochrome c oxidase subunit II
MTLHIETAEKRYMAAMALFLCAAAAALIISVVGHHASLPEPAGRVDPAVVRQTPPFDDVGVHQTGPNEYDVVMVAQAWSWDPAVVEVPAGADVTFEVTSTDVVHGMRVPHTNLNAMVIPGQITEVEINFDEPGTYTLLCHEYCGIGHHRMGGQIVVTEARG